MTVMPARASQPASQTAQLHHDRQLALHARHHLLLHHKLCGRLLRAIAQHDHARPAGQQHVRGPAGLQLSVLKGRLRLHHAPHYMLHALVQAGQLCSSSGSEWQ